jgi:hypothetical protein
MEEQQLLEPITQAAVAVAVKVMALAWLAVQA